MSAQDDQIIFPDNPPEVPKEAFAYLEYLKKEMEERLGIKDMQSLQKVKRND
jgi:hypothetical protein